MTAPSIPALLEPIQERLRRDTGTVAAPTDTARLLAAVKAVTKDHIESYRDVEPWATGYKFSGHHCIEDGEQWPCATVSAVEAALRGSDV